MLWVRDGTSLDPEPHKNSAVLKSCVNEGQMAGILDSNLIGNSKHH